MEVGSFISGEFSLYLFRCFAFHVNVHVDNVNKRSGKIRSKQRQIENSAIFVLFCILHKIILLDH